MRYFFALTAFLALVASSPATAQMYPGQDVTVNTAAAGRQVLLYPGGQYMRVVPGLLQPGETNGPIHLHMPSHHRFARARHLPAMAAAPQAEASVAPLAQPAPRAFSDFGDLTATQPTNPAPAPVRSIPKLEPKPAPPLRRVARTQPPVSSPQRVARVEPPPVPPPQRVARVESPPVQTPSPARLSMSASNPEAASGTKRGVILFAPNASDPAVSALQTAKSLAGELNAALGDATSRVQLLAFSGMRGDKSSDTRRLSLKRALIIRQVLIDEGVPAERIDVRAMGGTEDNGPLDRVDVFLKS
jgi:outer membrane protein OmpA-like peptidoglycan-associated protein